MTSNVNDDDDDDSFRIIISNHDVSEMYTVMRVKLFFSSKLRFSPEADYWSGRPLRSCSTFSLHTRSINGHSTT